jgi:hypothetical protein
MRPGKHSLGVLWLATLAMAQAPATPPEATRTPSDFVRFVKVGDGGHLDTAVTTYRNDRGFEVVLYAAVHIADAVHYTALQDRFASRDALLYELVAESDVRPQKGEGGSGSMISLLQTGMKSALELEFQLDAVDYTAPNFVHADMTPDEFAAAMKERGESIWTTILNLGRAAARSQDEDVSDTGFQFDLVKAFRSGEGRHRLRLMMASQLARAEALGGTTAESTSSSAVADAAKPAASAAKPQAKGSTLLEGRNQKCFEVLARELQAGKQRLGIYYGAAHLPDMEQRLLAQGFRKTGQDWLQAWDCAPRPDPKADRELWAQRRKARTEIDALARAARAWQAERSELRAPTFVELAQPRSDGKRAFAGAKVDPWGKDYAMAGYPQADAAQPELIDVWSAGQDGAFDTADDIHSLASRELQRSRRAQEASGKREVAIVQGVFDGLHKQARVDKGLKAKADVAALSTTIKVFEQLKKRLPQPGELTAPDERGVKFMGEWPIDPWGNDYVMRPAGTRLEVRSAGPDGVLDTEDDVVAPPPAQR